MAKKTPDSKRRRADTTDDEKPVSKQKTRHNSRTTTPPTDSMRSPPPTDSMRSAIATGPPPVRFTSNPKITASAAKKLPPIPMDDDLVPPVMNPKQQSQALLASDIKQKRSQPPPTSPMSPAAKQHLEFSETEEEDEVATSSSVSFSWLLAILLFAIAGSAGFVHQRIVQELQTQCKGHSQNFDWSQKQLKRAIVERKAAGEDLEVVRTEFVELVHEIRAISRQQLISR